MDPESEELQPAIANMHIVHKAYHISLPGISNQRVTLSFAETKV